MCPGGGACGSQICPEGRRYLSSCASWGWSRLKKKSTTHEDNFWNNPKAISVEFSSEEAGDAVNLDLEQQHSYAIPQNR